MSAPTAAARVGTRAYWWFKFRTLLVPRLMPIVFAAVMAYAIWSDEHPSRV